MSATKEEILHAVAGMTVLELCDLIQLMEEKFHVSAAVTSVVAASVSGPAAVVEEPQTEFDVILSTIGANKVSVIKAVREATSLGLKEAKDLVEGAPKVVKEGLPRADADALAKKLRDAGATAEVK